MQTETIYNGKRGEVHILSNKRKSREFAIIKLELELIPFPGSSNGASLTTRASHFKFMPSAEVLSGITGPLIHCCHYLFYALRLPEFCLLKTCTHILTTPGPLCACINQHLFSSTAEWGIYPNRETTKSNCISNFLQCQISPVQK